MSSLTQAALCVLIVCDCMFVLESPMENQLAHAIVARMRVSDMRLGEAFSREYRERRTRRATMSQA